MKFNFIVPVPIIFARQLVCWIGGKINENNQFLHDRIFYTTVIKKNRYSEFCNLKIKEEQSTISYIVSIFLTILIIVFFI